jgi:hypothetical protein
LSVRENKFIPIHALDGVGRAEETFGMKREEWRVKKEKNIR